ncbi:MAG TPA: Sua5/YciO/YrdC/YwlC family protein, partial [bacterium]|nr:Sua5/YciO/YrdC/YwlC family protein [bacterium]
IVLLRKREPCHLPDAIAPQNRYLGVMLPYTPLHHLLFDDDVEILVMTSGNRADEPIAYRDDKVVEHLAGIADYYLTHDRAIGRRVDDSVTRVFRGREYAVRRSRGYVPLPLELGRTYKTSVLAVGAELKNTFCLTKGSQAFVAHHVGDLENVATLEAFEEGIAHFRDMFDDDVEVLVMTSGNRADEPIAYRDDMVAEHLGGIADYFLTHDRAIARRVDDTVTRVFRGREYPVRRSRGYVPLPLELGRDYRTSVLAVGAELKNTFCLTKGSRAFVSHHIGDLENVATLEAFEEGIAHFREMFDVTPAAVARDLHPDYLASRYAMASGLAEVVVQHHHAHVASVLADAGYYEGKVIGVAFDGAGLGDDGAVWGGEFLIADLAGYERAAHLKYVPLAGGDAAAREPWRMALSWLRELYGGDALKKPLAFINNIPRGQRELVLEVAARGVNSPPTSSMGRLFDAVAALAGLRNFVNYEGQAAAELEQSAAADEAGAYSFSYHKGETLVIDAAPVIEGVVADARADTAPGVIAARFHSAVAAMVADVASRLRDEYGLSAVALGGGCFQNITLMNKLRPLLEERGFSVLIHERVPTNDGGLSLGQAAVALARLERENS